MHRLLRKAVRHHDRLGRFRQMLLDLIEAQDAVDSGDIQGAVAIGHADRHVQPACESIHFISALIAVGIHDRINITLASAADKQRAVLPESHPSRIRNIVRVHGDRETWRKFDLL